MKDRISNLKNLLWAAAILLCMLGMLVALIFSMSQKSTGSREDGTITLGQIERVKKEKGSDVIGLESAVKALIPLPESSKGNLESVFGMTFLCDKTIMGIKTYASNYGDGIIPSIWTDNGSGLLAKNGADNSIVFVDGSLITPANAAMVTRPRTIVIYLGADGLADTTQQEFVDGYTGLIQSLRSASPNANIVVCSIASISSNYQGSDGLTPQLIWYANQWIRQICVDTGVYYADLASFLNDESGYLSDSYLMPDGRSIAALGIQLIIDYFRAHYI